MERRSSHTRRLAHLSGPLAIKAARVKDARGRARFLALLGRINSAQAQAMADVLLTEENW